ncbi:MAG TPA: YdbH domain-containing protein, partial [Candidatus Deferrimicrobium sp.]|nr:YdbH domain-containing protein [Candidatus Deferrimicrobium sp.]
SLATPAFSASISRGNIIKGSVNLDFKLNRHMQPENVQLKLRIENIDDKVIQVEIPFNIDITGSRLTNLQLKLDYLKLKQPPGIHFRDFNGTASLDNGRLQAQGAFACGIDAEFFPWLSPGLKMEGGLSFKGNVQVLADDKGTTWNLSGLGGGKVLFTTEDLRAGMGNLAISLAAVGKGDRIENRLDVDLKNVAIKYEDLVFSAAHIFSQNNINMTDGKNWTGWGKVKMETARLKQTDGIDAQGIDLDAAWQYPFTRANQGNWTIASLKLGNLDLGKLTGEVKQKEDGFDFSGDVQTPVEPLKMKMTGSFDWPEKGNGALLQVEIPETQIVKDSQLSRLHPSLAGYRLLGYISGSATVTFLQGNLHSGARLKFHDLEMESDTGGIKSRGMKSEIIFKDLLNFKTEVEQRIDFESMEVSGLQLNKGHLVFEIISPDSIYIEGGEFAFSDGRILLQPLRYNFNGKDLKITIYGDRINFAEMVNKLQGDQIAFGKAELNGLLTVRISDGIPVFRDGYLYSTPGVGGNIKFERSETISGGVLLVEEAVKNFNYEWIKLKLDTVKDKLNITAFINGVPADKLPLTYDMKTKDIVRDKGGKRSLELKGLLLELRFKDLDLKRLMQGGLKIYSQEKKKKPQ